MNHRSSIPQPAPPRRAEHRFRGFTLAEVMFAVLILGIGLIAVASLFPVAGTIQRNTVSRVAALNVGRSAIAYLNGRGLPAASFPETTVPADKTVGDLPAAVMAMMPMTERSYPSSDASPPYYWVPKYRYDKTNGTGFRFYIFIMQTIGTSDAPLDANVAQSGHCLAGDVVVQTDGAVKLMGPLDDNAAGSVTANFWRGVAVGAIPRSLNVVTAGQEILK